MPRKQLIRSTVHPYHVTVRCNNKEQFYCDLSFVWKTFAIEFNNIMERFHPKIHAFLLMPNHFHLLITTPAEDLGVIMQNLISPTTKIINVKSGRSGRVFGARYHWSLINSANYYDCALKYVYRNPVKAGIVDSVQNYAFSTLRSVLGHEKYPFLIEPPSGYDFNIPSNKRLEFLDWLNQPFKTEEEQSIRFGFTKSRFNTPRNPNNKKRLQLNGFSENYTAALYQKVSDT
jgi:putative transposase